MALSGSDDMSGIIKSWDLLSWSYLISQVSASAVNTLVPCPCKAMLADMSSMQERKNIVENNKNPHYWKELKNEIEVLDLNFLEFHADAVDCSELPSDYFNKTYDYKEGYDKKNRSSNDLTFQYLDEVKYAISNLSTPSHVHDESILQK